jgi:hypothetical protein
MTVSAGERHSWRDYTPASRILVGLPVSYAFAWLQRNSRAHVGETRGALYHVLRISLSRLLGIRPRSRRLRLQALLFDVFRSGYTAGS